MPVYEWTRLLLKFQSGQSSICFCPRFCSRQFEREVLIVVSEPGRVLRSDGHGQINKRALTRHSNEDTTRSDCRHWVHSARTAPSLPLCSSSAMTLYFYPLCLTVSMATHIPLYGSPQKHFVRWHLLLDLLSNKRSRRAVFIYHTNRDLYTMFRSDDKEKKKSCELCFLSMSCSHVTPEGLFNTVHFWAQSRKCDVNCMLLFFL